MTDLTVLYIIGSVLIIVGLIVISTIIFRCTRRNIENRSEMRGGGIIMIGPIPIIFGTDKKSIKEVIILALAFVVVLFLVLIMYYWFLR